MKNKFRKFLQDNRVYDAFCENAIQTNPDFDFNNYCNNTHPHALITGAFIWSESTTGNRHLWASLEIKWQKMWVKTAKQPQKGIMTPKKKKTS